MIGLTGVLKALQDTGVLDCAMYIAGLSGSSWCISTLYSHENQEEDSSKILKENNVEKNKENKNDEVDTDSITDIKEGVEQQPMLDIEDFKIKLRKSVNQRWEWNLLKMGGYMKDLISKYYKGQNTRPLSWVDIFGHLIGDVLLNEKKNSAKLSDFQKKLEGGAAPFPLCAALHATDRSCKEFSEWMEFSPFEIGLARYGSFMKTETFGSKFLAGKLIKRFDEMSLYTLQGIWGSAFTVNLKRNMLTSDIKDIYGEDHDEYADMESSLEIEEEESDTDSDEEEEIINVIKEVKPKKVNNEKDKKLSEKSTPNGKTSTNTKTTDSPKSENSGGLLALLGRLGVDTSELLNRRVVKPGTIYNPFRGLSLKYSFSQKTDVPDSTDASFNEGCICQPIDLKAKKIPLMDSGFAFNSPYPLLLRPQRGVKLILSFDFSPRKDDLTTNETAFKNLLLAEKWANERYIPFPSVKQQIPQYFGKDLQEAYVFKNPDDKAVPVIIHFPLVNNQFRKYKLPGVVREEDDKFGDFNCFDENNNFSTFKFAYENEEFDRLSSLTEFNTLLSMDIIKREMKEAIVAKSQETALGIHEVAKMVLWHYKQKKNIQ